MEQLFSALIEHPERAITVLALFVALWLGKRLLSSFEKKIESNETNTAQWSKDVQDELKSTKEVVQKHSEDLGKATKAINGDFLRIKESVLDLRQDIATESELIKTQLNNFKSEILLVSQKAQFISDSFAEKTGKIILVEQNMAKVLSDTKKHEEIIGKIIKVVNTNVTDIKSLKSK